MFTYIEASDMIYIKMYDILIAKRIVETSGVFGLSVLLYQETGEVVSDMLIEALKSFVNMLNSAGESE